MEGLSSASLARHLTQTSTIVFNDWSKHAFRIAGSATLLRATSSATILASNCLWQRSHKIVYDLYENFIADTLGIVYVYFSVIRNLQSWLYQTSLSLFPYWKTEGLDGGKKWNIHIITRFFRASTSFFDFVVLPRMTSSSITPKS